MRRVPPGSALVVLFANSSFSIQDFFGGFMTTPAKIVNYSFGADATADDDAWARLIDYFADVYGLQITVAAGNRGPL